MPTDFWRSGTDLSPDSKKMVMIAQWKTALGESMNRRPFPIPLETTVCSSKTRRNLAELLSDLGPGYAD